MPTILVPFTFSSARDSAIPCVHTKILESNRSRTTPCGATDWLCDLISSHIKWGYYLSTRVVVRLKQPNTCLHLTTHLGLNAKFPLQESSFRTPVANGPLPQQPWLIPSSYFLFLGALFSF